MKTYMGKTIQKKFPFKSKTNPNKAYECLLYTDGTTSCNCPGWTRRNFDVGRECKHTMLVDQMNPPKPAGSLNAVGVRKLVLA